MVQPLPERVLDPKPFQVTVGPSIDSQREFHIEVGKERGDDNLHEGEYFDNARIIVPVDSGSNPCVSVFKSSLN
jgi:hypothetical protein